MRAGKLRHPITIQKFVSTENTNGETSKVWQDHATRRAGIDGIAGREVWMGQKVAAFVTHGITLRADAGLVITAEMRVVFGGRIFDINSAINVGEVNKQYNLLCTEVV